jgi:hypothetical protein
VSDKYLDSATFGIFEASWAQLTFRHNFNLQSGFDGGVLEISSFYINNGDFTDITDPAVGGSFITGGYNATIATGTGSPIAGRQAWSGNSGGFITTTVSLPLLVVNGKLRWRMASDNSGAGEGWRIDNVSATECHFSGPPSPTPTATVTPTVTPTGTPSATATATPTATPTGTPMATPTATATATPTVTSTPTVTPTGTPTATPISTPTPTTPPGQLGNISTRLKVETGDNVLIGGFIVTGTQSKKVIVRAIGPSLTGAGVPGALANPTLELHGPTGLLIASNDNWMDATNRQEIIDSTLAPTNDLESAILTTLPANNAAYTAIVRGVNDSTGVGLVEAYDLDRTVNSKLANISTRGLVQTGNNVMIGGFIMMGNTPKQVIVRAIGPSLPLSGKLADPILELHDGNGMLLQSNDNWMDAPNRQEIVDSTLAPTNDLESAILMTLPANNSAYTAIVHGVANSTGVALVEVYALN